MNIINKKYDNILINFRLEKDKSSGLKKESIKCPRCKIGTIKKQENVLYGFCDYCPNNSTYMCFWEPQPYQKVILQLNNKWVYNFGAMGSGKTDADCAKLFRHLIEVNNAYILVIANDLQTARDNITASLLQFIPREFIKHNENQTNRIELTKDKITLKNGSTIQIFSSQNPETYRGRNATGAYVIEANTIDEIVVQQLEGRIRNKNQVIFAKDENGNFIFEEDENGILRQKTIWEFGQILVESNPDPSSWIFKNGLLKAKTIIHSYHVDPKAIESYKKIDQEKFKSRVAVIVASIDNKYAPKNLLTGLKEWSDSERRRHLYGEFVPDGTPVWPTIMQQEIKNANHEKDWPHLLAGDWGTTNDPVCFIHSYIDPYREKLIIWKCEYLYQKSISKVAYHLKQYFTEYNYLYDKKVIDSAIWSKNPDLYTDGGKSVAQQLNSYPFFLGINPANKRIKEGEIAVENLIADDLIEFDTMGEGVLSLLVDLSQTNYPKITDTTKRGENKTIARIITDNHKYDTIRYKALSVDRQWIKKISEQYRNKDKQKNPYNNQPNIASLAVDLQEESQSKRVWGINYGAWLNEED